MLLLLRKRKHDKLCRPLFQERKQIREFHVFICDKRLRDEGYFVKCFRMNATAVRTAAFMA